MAKTAAEIQRDYRARGGSQKEYDTHRANTRQVVIRFHNINDNDILTALEGKAAGTEIKRLVRAALAYEKSLTENNTNNTTE